MYKVQCLRTSSQYQSIHKYAKVYFQKIKERYSSIAANSSTCQDVYGIGNTRHSQNILDISEDSKQTQNGALQSTLAQNECEF